MDIRFENLDALHWLWGLPAIIVLVVAGWTLRRRALERLADRTLVPHLTPRVSSGRVVVRTVLLLLAVIALTAAMIDPRWGVRYSQAVQRGIDIMIVLDISRSMTAEDVRPNRLERTRQFIGDLVEGLAGDRVGLITFAGSTQVQCPLTVDYGAFRTTLATVSPGDAARGGSLLGDALRNAADAFTDDDPKYKAIVVFSDGEDHGSYPLEAAQRLAEESQIPVYTVAIGDAREGGRIPVNMRGQRTYLVHDGQEVWSKMDSSVLRQIALTTGGAYIPAGTATLDMAQVYRERIEPTAKREYESRTVRRYTPRYQWFAALGLALLLMESFMGRASGKPTRPAWEGVQA